MTFRRATAADLAEIARIQTASPEASQWDPASYLEQFCLVASHETVEGENVCGYLVARQTAADEFEILNLAVDPSVRRQGVGRGLLQNALRNLRGACFLEVRASNLAGIALYRSLGFAVGGQRKAYYNLPLEDAIVMKIDS